MLFQLDEAGEFVGKRGLSQSPDIEDNTAYSECSNKSGKLYVIIIREDRMTEKQGVKKTKGRLIGLPADQLKFQKGPSAWCQKRQVTNYQIDTS
jgi:hypothetical protein